MIDVLLIESTQNMGNFYFPEWAKIYREIGEKEVFDVTFLRKELTWEDVQILFRCVKAYTLFVSTKVNLNEATRWFIESRKGRIIEDDEIQSFIIDKLIYYFPELMEKCLIQSL